MNTPTDLPSTFNIQKNRLKNIMFSDICSELARAALHVAKKARVRRAVASIPSMYIVTFGTKIRFVEKNSLQLRLWLNCRKTVRGNRPTTTISASKVEPTYQLFEM